MPQSLETRYTAAIDNYKSERANTSTMERGSYARQAGNGSSTGGPVGGASLVAMINPSSPGGAQLGVKKHNNILGNVVIGGQGHDGLANATLPLNQKKNSGVAQYARGKKELQSLGLMMGDG